MEVLATEHEDGVERLWWIGCEMGVMNLPGIYGLSSAMMGIPVSQRNGMTVASEHCSNELPGNSDNYGKNQGGSPRKNGGMFIARRQPNRL